MNEIEVILDRCLQRMTTETLPVEELLAQYPEQAVELRPLLEAAARVRIGSQIAPAPGFKAAARGRLLSHLAAAPASPTSRLVPAWRRAVLISSLVLFLLAGTTAFAQTALPGQVLYEWKLDSEIVWRTMSADPVGVDLSLAGRRTDEMTSVARDPVRAEKARDEFHVVLGRLEAEKDQHNGPEIDKALQAHQQKLKNEGIKDNKLDEMVKDKGPKTK